MSNTSNSNSNQLPENLEEVIMTVYDNVGESSTGVSTEFLLEATALPFYRNGTDLVFNQLIVAADLIAEASISDDRQLSTSLREYNMVRARVLRAILEVYSNPDFSDEIANSPIAVRSGISSAHISDFCKDMLSGTNPDEALIKFREAVGQ